MRIYRREDLNWRRDTLRLDRRELACLVPDGKWSGMWRVKLANGRLTDMANKAWAKETAFALALRTLHAKQETQETPPGPSHSVFSPTDDLRDRPALENASYHGVP